MKKSAGILAYRTKNKMLEVVLVHPGGPFFAKKDIGIWSIPKGEFTENEDAFETAKREFVEEIGQNIMGNFIPLKPIVQKGGKMVYAWAVNSDVDITNSISNTFEIEWPPKSGMMKIFPEVDKAEWFDVTHAKIKINPRQVLLIDELIQILGIE